MSWSFYGMGKPAALAAKAKKDLTAFKCAEPEETIKNKALDVIETALLAMADSAAVRIEAHGSQGPAHDAAHNRIEGRFDNTFKLTIEPIYGFVE